MNVAIVGERERDWTEADSIEIEKVITELNHDHGLRLIIISVGCDQGVGKHTMEVCKKIGVKFVEFRIKFDGKTFPRQFFGQIFKARNMSLLDVCDFFYVFLGPNPRGLVQEIVEPARERVGPDRVKVYPFI